jgi:hypothetical protein
MSNYKGIENVSTIFFFFIVTYTKRGEFQLYLSTTLFPFVAMYCDLIESEHFLNLLHHYSVSLKNGIDVL